MISGIIFSGILFCAVYFFSKHAGAIRKNILLGRDVAISGSRRERILTMLRVAFGQSKMTARPVAAVMHFLIYVGFVVINIEIIEIILDGITSSHRIFYPFMNHEFYRFLISTFEVLAAGVFLACIVFLSRRNIISIKRFRQPELKKWPLADANLILVTEIIITLAFLFMNAADTELQKRGVEHYPHVGAFPLSSLLLVFFSEMETSTLVIFERALWWIHIVLILGFLNYIPFSKHLHIFLAFPNTYYSNLNPKGKISNMEAVTREVQMMLDPNIALPENPSLPASFGAKDVRDLSWKQLLDAYSCTECGRCTAVCPANITGKKLSPRKIMMDTRDRLEEVGENIRKAGQLVDDGNQLLSEHYISAEEIWACTTCNACVQACPVNIDPLSIILDLRRYAVMEQSAAPSEINGMFSNIENNGAPWKFSPADRFNWKDEISS
jgi:heterodisulfide reductase subunit C